MQVHAPNSMLYLDGVSVAFDGFKAINELTLAVAPGDTVLTTTPCGFSSLFKAVPKART